MDGKHDADSPLFDEELARHYGALKCELAKQVRKIYSRWHRPLSEVEDEVNDLFVGILKAKSNYDPSVGSFKPWANKVAMRRLADRQRQFRREGSRFGTRYESHYSSDAAFNLILEHCAVDRGAEPRDERIDDMLRELDRLPAKERYVIRRRFYDDDGYASIARDLGITEAAVRGIVVRGMDRLARRMRPALRHVMRGA